MSFIGSSTRPCTWLPTKRVYNRCRNNDETLIIGGWKLVHKRVGGSFARESSPKACESSLRYILRNSSPDVNRKRQLFPPTSNPAGEAARVLALLSVFTRRSLRLRPVRDEFGEVGNRNEATVRRGSRPSFHETMNVERWATFASNVTANESLFARLGTCEYLWG